MECALFEKGRTRVKGSLEVQLLGLEAAEVVMLAIERLHFSSWRDIQFMPRFRVMEGGVPGIVVSMTVGSSNSQAAGEGDTERQGDVDILEGAKIGDVDILEGAKIGDVNILEGAKIGDADILEGAKIVDWSPPVMPQLFQALLVASTTSRLALATKVTALLAVYTTKAVELSLRDSGARAKLLYTMASLPPWLQAVGQVAPRKRDSRSRLRIAAAALHLGSLGQEAGASRICCPQQPRRAGARRALRRSSAGGIPFALPRLEQALQA